MKKLVSYLAIGFFLIVSGCSSIPMASMEADANAKLFKQPSADKVGIYIYRDNFVGQAVKKEVSIDGVVIGETMNKVFFYREIAPGEHRISTDSEFGDNYIDFTAVGGNNYFAKQFIKMGVFVAGSGIEMVNEEQAKREILNCKLAL